MTKGSVISYNLQKPEDGLKINKLRLPNNPFDPSPSLRKKQSVVKQREWLVFVSGE
jgi:hypothetical protein